MSFPTCQDVKRYSLIVPQAIKDNAEWVGSADNIARTVDCKGYKSLLVVFQLGSIDATIGDLRLLTSDSAASGYEAIDGADFETDGTAPGANDDNMAYVWRIDCRKIKRYVRIKAVAGNGASGTYGYCEATLFDPEQSPVTATEMNADGGLLEIF